MMAEPRNKKPVSFEDELDALMRKHAVVDYALAGTRSDRAKVRMWVAGEGDDVAMDEDRIAVLGHGLDLVKREMQEYCTNQGNKKGRKK